MVTVYSISNYHIEIDIENAFCKLLVFRHDPCHRYLNNVIGIRQALIGLKAQVSRQQIHLPPLDY